MILVTGSSGFIGSNIIKRINSKLDSKIVSIDYFDPRERFANFPINSHITPDEFISDIERCVSLSSVVIHQGANTCTTDHSQNMFKQNFEFTKLLIDECLRQEKRIIYASSAAVYGNGNSGFNVSRECEYPLNIYGFSKLLVDDYVRSILRLQSHKSQIVGLRYFNAYGPGEEFKGKMASTIFHFFNQSKSGKIKPFYGSDKFLRDFIYIDDLVDQVMHYISNDKISGIFNCGTGKERSFLDVANIISKITDSEIEEIEFPESLAPYYQSFTKAEMEVPHSLGIPVSKIELEEGIDRYISQHLAL